MNPVAGIISELPNGILRRVTDVTPFIRGEGPTIADEAATKAASGMSRLLDAGERRVQSYRMGPNDLGPDAFSAAGIKDAFISSGLRTAAGLTAGEHRAAVRELRDIVPPGHYLG